MIVRSSLARPGLDFTFLFLDVVKVVNLQGKMKSSKRQQSELHFDFTISYIGEACPIAINNAMIAMIADIISSYFFQFA